MIWGDLWPDQEQEEIGPGSSEMRWGHLSLVKYLCYEPPITWKVNKVNKACGTIG